MLDISWLKLDIHILDNKKIKLIRKYPGGDSLFTLWIGLLCLAMKSDKPGYIFISTDIPYEVSELANILELEIKTVELGLQLFKRFRMIDILVNGIIEVVDFNIIQDIDKIENRRERDRIRQQKYRQKAIEDVTRDTGVTNADVTPQRREEKRRREKKRGEESKKEIPSEIIDLTQKLYDSIDKPTRWLNKPPSLFAWSKDIEKLHRIDGISIELIERVIDHIAKHDKWKWREIIQSGSGFRKHFDKIEKQLPKDRKQTSAEMKSDAEYYEEKIKKMIGDNK